MHVRNVCDCVVVVSLAVLCDSLCEFFFFQAEDGIRDLVRSRGLGDVYKRQEYTLLCWRLGEGEDRPIELGADVVLGDRTAGWAESLGIAAGQVRADRDEPLSAVG